MLLQKSSELGVLSLSQLDSTAAKTSERSVLKIPERSLPAASWLTGKNSPKPTLVVSTSKRSEAIHGRQPETGCTHYCPTNSPWSLIRLLPPLCFCLLAHLLRCCSLSLPPPPMCKQATERSASASDTTITQKQF